MPNRFTKAALVLTGVSMLSIGAAAMASASASSRAVHRLPRVGGPLVRTNSHEALPLEGGSVQSSNWAEIGGYSSADLIQAGVAEDSIPSNPLLGDQYYAWYELLPGDSVQLTDCSGESSCAVNPGDVVSVHIFQTANDVWTIDVGDSGHWTWSDSLVSYTSTHSSAEWILETPQVDGVQSIIAGDGTALFAPTDTYTVGSGGPQSIASSDPTQIDLTTPEVPSINVATPSALAPDGQSFNVCVYAESCAAPS